MTFMWDSRNLDVFSLFILPKPCLPRFLPAPKIKNDSAATFSNPFISSCCLLTPCNLPNTGRARGIGSTEEMESSSSWKALLLAVFFLLPLLAQGMTRHYKFDVSISTDASISFQALQSPTYTVWIHISYDVKESIRSE